MWYLLCRQAGVSAPTKKIDIFCMMNRCDRRYPMSVVVLSSAKIFQLIGLICWQYTMEGKQPPLKFVFLSLIHGDVLDMHHLTCGISCLLCLVSLILFTVLLVHLILHASPHHSPRLRSDYLSLPQSFTADFVTPLLFDACTDSSDNRLLLLPCSPSVYIHVVLYFFLCVSV